MRIRKESNEVEYNQNNILIIVKAGQYQNEILKQLKELNEDAIIRE